jgi:hypothetical protein
VPWQRDANRIRIQSLDYDCVSEIPRKTAGPFDPTAARTSGSRIRAAPYYTECITLIDFLRSLEIGTSAILVKADR